jgi:outer membrane immunogenic protein
MKTCNAVIASVAMLAVPTLASAQNWDGPYGGLTAGFAKGDATHTYSNGAPTGNSDPDGALLGGFLGFAWQTGTTVWALEADIESSDFNGSFVNNTGATSSGVIDGKWQASIRGVLGYDGNLGGNPALYYVTAGWATGKFDFNGGPSAPFPPVGGYSDTLNGWTLGVGIDWLLAANTSMRIEYRHTDFGSTTGPLVPTFPGVNMPVNVDQDALRIGVRFQF